jgi:hypothetical protein
MEEDQAVSRQPQRSSGVSSRLADTINRLDIDPDTYARETPPPRALYARYDLGYELHLLRYAAGMNLKEFGEYTGLSTTSVWEWEHGVRNYLTLEALDKVAQSFGLRVKVSFEKAENQDDYSWTEEFYDKVGAE